MLHHHLLTGSPRGNPEVEIGLILAVPLLSDLRCLRIVGGRMPPALACNPSVSNVLSCIERKLCGWPLLGFLELRVLRAAPENDIRVRHEGLSPCCVLRNTFDGVAHRSDANIAQKLHRRQSIF
jgi:hypothetical protein